MKSNSGSSSSSSGIGFLGLLQVAFIVLKLCHVIEWSWWLVFVPTWGSILVFVIFFIVLVWIMRK